MKWISVFWVCCMLLSCEKQFDNSFENTPENNFEVFWNEFDRFYSYFDYKQVNWDSLYRVYRPKVSSLTSEEELLGVLAEMSYYLRDGHVTLKTPFGWRQFNFHANDLSPTSNFIGIELLDSYLESMNNISNTLYYGKITQANIGYIYLANFSDDPEVYQQIDQILEQLLDTDGIIIDVRMNGGGTDTYGTHIASRFADSQRMFRKIRYRNGPDHNDFSDWIEGYITPSEKTYLKPVVVLTNAYCFSSAENFILAMKVFPHVTTLGDTTGGGSGNPIFRELPNGWTFRLSNWQSVDPGMNYIEGRGIYPDVPIWLTQEEYNTGKDRILEEAIERLVVK